MWILRIKYEVSKKLAFEMKYDLHAYSICHLFSLNISMI